MTQANVNQDQLLADTIKKLKEVRESFIKQYDSETPIGACQYTYTPEVVFLSLVFGDMVRGENPLGNAYDIVNSFNKDIAQALGIVIDY